MVSAGLVVELLLVVGLVVGDVQPDTNKEATTSDRTSIAVIGFNCIRFMQEVRGSLKIPVLIGFRFFGTRA